MMTKTSKICVAGVAVIGLAIGVPVGTNLSAERTTSPDVTASTHDDASFSAAIRELRDERELGDAIWVENSLEDTFPNVLFSIDGAPAAPLYGGLIEGVVTSVEAGPAYRDEVDIESGAENQVEVEFGSKEGSWAVVEVTVRVEDDFDDSVVTPEEVRLAVTIYEYGLLSEMQEGFPGRRVFVVLDREDKTSLTPELIDVARNGELLGFVEANGNISIPLLQTAEPEFLQELTSIDAIAVAADKPVTTVDVKFEDGFAH